MLPLSAYFKDDFQEEEINKDLWIANEGQGCVDAALIGRNMDASKNANAYGCAINCAIGPVYHGGLTPDIAYHPSLPLRNALTALTFSHRYTRRHSIREIVIAQTGKMPTVPYLERQHLLEFAKTVSNKSPVSVALVQADERGNTQKVWKTDSDEWLPYGFFPEILLKK